MTGMIIAGMMIGVRGMAVGVNFLRQWSLPVLNNIPYGGI